MGSKLFLLRHAEADSGSGDDKSRPLSDKGISDAQALGKSMERRGYIPKTALCSPAVRTRRTLEELKAAFDAEIHSEYPEALYNGGRHDILQAILSTDDGYDSILVVAHNPGMHELGVTLAADGAQSLMSKLMTGMRPGTLFALECPCGTWGEFRPGNNILIDVLDPLDYNAPSTPARWT